MAKVGKKVDSPEGLSPVADELMFNWNGHLWGAYEVLGLTPGATQAEVEEAYLAEIIKIDKHSQAFIKMAYELIISKIGAEHP